MQMRSNKPYLLRAFYEWIVDSNCTPIIVIDATNPRCKIPADHVQGGEIVFNVSPTAIRDLDIRNDAVEFKASFNSIIHIISAPVKAIMALYADENNEGIFFDGEDDADGANEEIVELKSIEGSASAGTFGSEMNSGEMTARKDKPFLKLVE